LPFRQKKSQLAETNLEHFHEAELIPEGVKNKDDGVWESPGGIWEATGWQRDWHVGVVPLSPEKKSRTRKGISQTKKQLSMKRERARD